MSKLVRQEKLEHAGRARRTVTPLERPGQEGWAAGPLRFAWIRIKLKTCRATQLLRMKCVDMQPCAHWAEAHGLLPLEPWPWDW